MQHIVPEKHSWLIWKSTKDETSEMFRPKDDAPSLWANDCVSSKESGHSGMSLVKRASCDKAWKFSLVLVAKGRHSPLALSCPLLCLASKVARHPGTYWVGRRTVFFAIQSEEGAVHSREVTKQKTHVLACETDYPFLQTNQENWRREWSLA